MAMYKEVALYAANVNRNSLNGKDSAHLGLSSLAHVVVIPYASPSTPYLHGAVECSEQGEEAGKITSREVFQSWKIPL